MRVLYYKQVYGLVVIVTTSVKYTAGHGWLFKYVYYSLPCPSTLSSYPLPPPLPPPHSDHGWI